MEKIYLVRLALASLFGAVIGLDREFRAKEAGIRTHFLVCLASALLMIVSQHGFVDLSPAKFDGSRIAAQVVSGIGFIGAGMIITQKRSVKGLTSAAGIWATSAIGLAVGGGMYVVSAVATILTLLGFELTNFFMPNVDTHATTYTVSTTKEDALLAITKLMEKNEKAFLYYETKREIFEDTKVFRVTFTIRTKNIQEEMDILKLLQAIPHVTVEKYE